MTANLQERIRIGIDLGGTKIAAAALLPDGQMTEELRLPTPRNDYEATLESIRQLVEQLEANTGERGTVGVGMPGSISPATGLVQNSNSTWLNMQPFDRDLSSGSGGGFVLPTMRTASRCRKQRTERLRERAPSSASFLAPAAAAGSSSTVSC
jgi:predicted NBD/HSP70 family sugar kinase